MAKHAASQSSYSPRRTFDKATLTDRVYDSLREDILSNRLPPGTPLQEATIASALDVSRGPVREALRRLHAEGLVSMIPRRVAVVSSLSRKEFLDAYRVREALEVLAIKLALPLLGPEDLERLDQLHQKMMHHAASEEVDAFFSANADFHALFVERSGNKKLRELYYPLMNQMRRYRVSSMSLRGGLVRSCHEHAEILRAVREGNVEEASRLLSEHIQVLQRILESGSEAELVPLNQEPGERDLQADKRAEEEVE